ncbi:g4438 [Coccomyxa elongata]
MTASGPSLALSWAVGLLLPLACLTQSPSFSFNPSNYHPPAGEAPASTSLIKVIKGNSTQVTGKPLDVSNLHFKGASLTQFPGVTFTGNQPCSPHGYQDSLAIYKMVVPTLEINEPAIRTWRQIGDSYSPMPQKVMYFDLQGGNIVVGKMVFNWTQQTSLVNYMLLIPNVVDLDQYRAALGDLIEIVQGLATGMPPWFNSGPGCNSPIPALNDTWTYLLGVRDAVSNSSLVSNGLRPTEVRLQSGCIEEIEANYQGDLISNVLPNTAGSNQCCQACRNTTGCNVWVWCPLSSGCTTGSGVFPFLGCQLKYQANVSTSAAPQPLPQAWSRGPPTGFVSGRLAYT